MTIEVDVQEAATRLSELLAESERGEDVVITRDGSRVVRLVPVVTPTRREVGFVAGSVPDTFQQPLPDAELARWE